jgi:magnesium chelatase family protein
MNPCFCGNFGNSQGTCHCTLPQLRKYKARISGPLLDRIDLRVEVPPVRFEELVGNRKEEDSQMIRERILAAQERQETRLTRHGLRFNSQMGPRLIKNTCPLDPECQKILEMAVKKWQLSARAFDRTLRVARTISDLKAEEKISVASLTEAIQYRLG